MNCLIEIARLKWNTRQTNLHLTCTQKQDANFLGLISSVIKVDCVMLISDHPADAAASGALVLQQIVADEVGKFLQVQHR